MSDPSASRTASENDRLAIDTIRFLSVDMVEAADSGHPGAPMGQAAMAYRLFTKHLRHSPDAPDWPNRDRFVLSCGHASALIYSLLHLSGYDLPLDELRRFRQLGSKTPGHPEHGLTPGVETTTGPLGQGLANAVGMAIGERQLRARWNREGFGVIDHRIWVIASDGDLMEGVACEASSLAGHQRLGRLNVLYDANRISIDGSTDLSFTEDVAARYRAYGWHVVDVADGNDLEALDAAMEAMKAEEDRPSIAVVRTIIGFGSPKKQDTAGVHGAPLGEKERAAAKENRGWPQEPTFHVPAEARAPFEAARARGREMSAEWTAMLDRLGERWPDIAAEVDRRLAGRLPDGWETHLPEFEIGAKVATRKASGAVLAGLGRHLPELIGGSADLTGSNNTDMPGVSVHDAENPAGRYLHFGVREHAMGSALNGLALSGLFRPFGGTFLIFSDYFRPAIRLAALMRQPAIYVLTHDSIFLGEDGPTHQPISQLASLRAIPGLTVWRPADAHETAQVWRQMLEDRSGPHAIALTRQGLPVTEEVAARCAEGVARGGYVVADAENGAPEAILIATGSEVATAMAARELLLAEGCAVRVVSLVSWERFAAQDRAWRDTVLPPDVRCRIAVEAASPFGWERWVGTDGAIVGLSGFGESAPAGDLAEHFGFTGPKVADVVRQALAASA